MTLRHPVQGLIWMSDGKVMTHMWCYSFVRDMTFLTSEILGGAIKFHAN